MGEVLQFKRAPLVQSGGGGFRLVINPAHEQWAHRDGGFYRLAPARDGTVALEVAHGGAALRLTMSVEDAERLSRDLRDAARVAEEQRKIARGATRWITAPIEGRDAFTVDHNDSTAIFVATKVRRAHACEVCRATMPAGSIMYRQEGRVKHRPRGGPIAYFTTASILCDMGRRVCRACMTPPPAGPALAPIEPGSP